MGAEKEIDQRKRFDEAWALLIRKAAAFDALEEMLVNGMEWYIKFKRNEQCLAEAISTVKFVIQEGAEDKKGWLLEAIEHPIAKRVLREGNEYFCVGKEE